jgi:hypothetical protein
MRMVDYEVQQAAYNRTIQHTVASSLDGVAPEQVSDIAVRAGSAASSCSLEYSVRVFDPRLTYDAVRAQLMESASLGRMDTHLHEYAEDFGITNLVNGTFVDVRVSNSGGVSGRGHSTSGLTGVAIAGVVVGVCLALVLAGAAVWFYVAVCLKSSDSGQGTANPVNVCGDQL